MVRHIQQLHDARDPDVTRVNGRFTPSPPLKKNGVVNRENLISTASTIGTRSGRVKKPNREKATEWLRLIPVARANDPKPHSLPEQIGKANGCVSRYSQPIVREIAILGHSDMNPEFLVLGTL